MTMAIVISNGLFPTYQDYATFTHTVPQKAHPKQLFAMLTLEGRKSRSSKNKEKQNCLVYVSLSG